MLRAVMGNGLGLKAKVFLFVCLVIGCSVGFAGALYLYFGMAGVEFDLHAPIRDQVAGDRIWFDCVWMAGVFVGAFGIGVPLYLCGMLPFFSIEETLGLGTGKK